ncbi:hypothetical protein Tco_0459236 [Tanacetum coccineum]
MADNRTMAQLLEAPTAGYEDAIVVPKITADNFELKHARILLEKEPPRSTSNMDYLSQNSSNTFFPPSKNINQSSEMKSRDFNKRFDETFFMKHWTRFNDLLRACPHHGFSELHQLDTFYNALNSNDQDSLNSAAGGNFLDKIPRDCLRIIKSKSKVQNSRNKTSVAKISTITFPGFPISTKIHHLHNQIPNKSNPTEITSRFPDLKDMVKALLLDKKNQSIPLRSTPVKAFEKVVLLASVLIPT